MNDMDIILPEPEWLLLEILQEKLGYKFNSPALLSLALTHTSWANERRNPGEHNERLEYLGDAVLELCVSTELYHSFPAAREGDLTHMRSRLVREETLAAIARDVGMPKTLKLGKGEERQGGRDRNSVLSDAMEAVFAAVFEDGGFAAALKVIKRLYRPYWPDTWINPATQDCKSRLQQITQHMFHDFPVYKLEGASGPEHAKVFVVSVALPDGSVFHAVDSSCKKAEQQAAASALKELENMREGRLDKK